MQFKILLQLKLISDLIIIFITIVRNLHPRILNTHNASFRKFRLDREWQISVNNNTKWYLK